MDIIRFAGTEGTKVLARMIKGEAEAESVETKIYSSEEFFHGAKMILIKHGEMFYRLMITKQGKLILTK